MKKKIMGIIYCDDSEFSISFLDRRQSNNLCKVMGCSNVFEKRPSLDTCKQILKLFKIPYTHLKSQKINIVNLSSKIHYRYDILIISKEHINTEFIYRYFVN